MGAWAAADVGGVSVADTKKVFRTKTTTELAGTAMMFRAARSSLMPPVRRLITATAEGTLGAPVRAGVKATVFRHFCSGETFKECESRAQQLQMEGVGAIIDHSVEEREDPDAWGPNMKAKVELLERCMGTASFVPVKVTALASPEMLERVTEVIQKEGRDAARAQFSEWFESTTASLSPLGEAAMQTGIPVLLDAEQTHRQPAVDLLALALSKRYNLPGRRAAVYNTYQMYLKDAPSRLAADLDEAHAEGYKLAAKIVRGAYIATETERASRLGIPCPVHNTKEDTNTAYDGAVRSMLQRLRDSPDSCAIIIATHNADSVTQACRAMSEMGLAKNHPSVHFAQILGMADNLTHGLAQGGFNALKLVLFGSYSEIAPWLMRRLDENGDSLSAMGGEQGQLLWKEVKRRLHLA